MAPTDDASGSESAELADDAGDVWSPELQSSAMEDVNETKPANDAKRGSLEFHEDLLHIKP